MATAGAQTPAAQDDGGAECTAPDERGIQKCRMGLGAERMQQLLRTQKGMEWCWAASIQMVFAGVGFDVAQEDVVLENFGNLKDEAVPAADITRLLNRGWRDAKGRAFVSSAEATLFGGDLRRATRQIMSELKGGRPLILGARRHAVVLAHVEFEKFTREDGIRITGGTVLDPALGVGVRKMAAYEMKAFYVARVQVAAGEGGAATTVAKAASADDRSLVAGATATKQ